MILSVSRRTDIPAFYSEWFFNRLKAGFVDVRNPMNVHQVSRVNIRPEVVDCIVFWTKDASRITERLHELAEYHYYFQYTINPYDKQIEEGVPTKSHIIDNFCKLSKVIGANRMVWRYDPILVTKNITIEYHLRYFEELAKRLRGYTNRCVISFVDLYKKTLRNTKEVGIQDLSLEEMHHVAKSIFSIGQRYGISVQSCSEKEDFLPDGIAHGHCIDKELIESIIGYSIDVKKDKNQRQECGCVQSIDIGQYNTCQHLCKYCYANYSPERVHKQSVIHDSHSTMLIGAITSEDHVKERSVFSLRCQTLF